MRTRIVNGDHSLGQPRRCHWPGMSPIICSHEPPRRGITIAQASAQRRAQHAAAIVSFWLSKRHASRVVNAQVSRWQELTRTLEMPRKRHKKGAKAFEGLLEG